jgi:hypothetical protein
LFSNHDYKCGEDFNSPPGVPDVDKTLFPNKHLKSYMRYCLDQATECCGEKDGDYKTKYGVGNHSKKDGSGYFSYGFGKHVDWKLTYYNGGDVGCLERFNNDKYKKNGDKDCYDVVCWDTCDMCSHDIPIDKCKDEGTQLVIKSYNQSKRTNHGGGFCSWGDLDCKEPFEGFLNVFTGDGDFTFNLKGKKHYYKIDDFEVEYDE